MAQGVAARLEWAGPSGRASTVGIVTARLGAARELTAV